MTKKEYNYWTAYGGRMPYTTTITDAAGYPIGIAYRDGTYTEFDPSSCSRVGTWVVPTHCVTWDGAMPDPHGGRTKGRLLPSEGPRYMDSLVVFKHLARGDNGNHSGNSKAQKRLSSNEPGTTESHSS